MTLSFLSNIKEKNEIQLKNLSPNFFFHFSLQLNKTTLIIANKGNKKKDLDVTSLSIIALEDFIKHIAS